MRQQPGTVLRCYMPKLPEWLSMEEGIKRSCLIKGMKAIMESSFLTKHMAGLGEMPAEVKRLLRG